jgi:hypothetical protein
MLGLYLFSLGVGGVLLAASFFADADAPDDIGDAGWQQLFSLRNFTYFLFVFGAIGSLMAWMRGGRTGVADFAIAGGAATAVALMVQYVFTWLRRTDGAEVPSDSALVGQAARVTLPVSASGPGKVELSFGGQRVELLARPYGSEQESLVEIGNGTEVVIVEMVAGTALVSRASTD